MKLIPIKFFNLSLKFELKLQARWHMMEVGAGQGWVLPAGFVAIEKVTSSRKCIGISQNYLCPAETVNATALVTQMEQTYATCEHLLSMKRCVQAMSMVLKIV